jgi:hypothetical protein
MAGFSSRHTKVYTHKNHGNIGSEDGRRAKVPRLVRWKQGPPQTPDIASAIWPDHPKVAAKVEGYAKVMGAVATSALARYDKNVESDWESANPRIEVVEGDRTDWHVMLVVGPAGLPSLDAPANGVDPGLAAAFSIERGRNGYTDKKGRKHPPREGAGALMIALWSVGWGH